MKKQFSISLLCGALLGFLTPAHSSHPIKPFNIEIFKASKENKALYHDYRTKWLRVTGFELSSLHWNQFVAVFINQAPEIYRNNYLEFLRTSQDDYDEDDDEEDGGGPVKYKKYPVGTLIAKEGFSSQHGKPGDPTFLVIMKKHKPGYDPKYGDWEYMQFTADGTTMLRGKSSDPAVNKACAACHINVADRDFVFSSYYSGTSAR